MTNVPAPEQRIRDFIERVDELNARHPEGSWKRYEDELDVWRDGATLTLSDIRDTLNELEAARGRITELEEKRDAAVTVLSQFAHLPGVQKLLDRIGDEP